MEQIYAGIVSFNPDLKRLKENIDAIHTQVEHVVVFDNGSKDQNRLKMLLLNYNNVELLQETQNIGIAAALNHLMQWGYERDFTWMLSLDQDSVCDENFVKKMKPYLSAEKNLGIVAPIIVDRNVGIVGHMPSSIYSHVNTCITSGSFSNIIAWNKIGRYDESMFIDSVDFEFCYRMRKNGYGVIQVKNNYLLHEIGQGKRRRFLFWNVHISAHNSFRKYYIARNNIYYPLKHHLWFQFIRGNVRNFWLVILVLLYEDKKKEKINAIFKGWKAAYMHEGVV